MGVRILTATRISHIILIVARGATVLALPLSRSPCPLAAVERLLTACNRSCWTLMRNSNFSSPDKVLTIGRQLLKNCSSSSTLSDSLTTSSSSAATSSSAGAFLFTNLVAFLSLPAEDEGVGGCGDGDGEGNEGNGCCDGEGDEGRVCCVVEGSE
ncbi:hypothetical protein RRG08_045674 [Elysia crispata]|uniref:Secreted protein n=1 Tax=Elysia crispata TaxID=231223 RepID=A0AAE0Z301_9GAST|nr:hypothetical protein RRG08_045674 [Elysia crispata]